MISCRRPSPKATDMSPPRSSQPSRRSRSVTRRGPNKRQRLDGSPQAGSTENDRPRVTIDDPGESQQQQPVMNPESSSRISWSQTVAVRSKQSMDFQIQKYKDWRRSGSHHERYCRLCLQSGELEPCHTCRLAFHAECIPEYWLRDSHARLFCAICVDRGWQVAAPALTPPASPTLSATPNTSGEKGNTAMNPISLDQNTPQEPAAVGRAPQGEPGSLVHETSLSQFQFPGNIVAPHSAAIGVAARRSKEPARGRPRQSRFTTLSTEVDASLTVLYRELESVAFLKSQIEELQAENLRSQQTIKLRDQSLQILHREINHLRASKQELESLRANAVHHANSSKEIDELRKSKTDLEAELQRSREQAATANEQLNDLRGKLSKLIMP